jgi:nucleoside-diphosphate-sugar epimerase
MSGIVAAAVAAWESGRVRKARLGAGDRQRSSFRLSAASSFVDAVHERGRRSRGEPIVVVAATTAATTASSTTSTVTTPSSVAPELGRDPNHSHGAPSSKPPSPMRHRGSDTRASFPTAPSATSTVSSNASSPVVIPEPPRDTPSPGSVVESDNTPVQSADPEKSGQPASSILADTRTVEEPSATNNSTARHDDHVPGAQYHGAAHAAPADPAEAIPHDDPVAEDSGTTSPRSTASPSAGLVLAEDATQEPSEASLKGDPDAVQIPPLSDGDSKALEQSSNSDMREAGSTSTRVGSRGSEKARRSSTLPLTPGHDGATVTEGLRAMQRLSLDCDVESMSPLNSSFDCSDRVYAVRPLDEDDDWMPPEWDSTARSESDRKMSLSASRTESISAVHQRNTVEVKRATAPRSDKPIVAVVGAESLLGSHIVCDVLNRGTRLVRAVVASAEDGAFLLHLPNARTLLEIIAVGDLCHSSSQIPLRGALRGVRYVVNAFVASAGNPAARPSTLARFADRAVAAASAIAGAAGAPGSSVVRLVHIGSDTAVFDPRSGAPERDGEIELDETCWYDVTDESRKFTEGEAFGSTAAEMLLWAGAAGDRVPYSMCSVIPSIMMGPMITPAHASSPGHKLLIDYIAKAYAIPPIPTPIVDCRDVASCVGSLVTTREHICGRVLMMGESLSSGELVAECRTLYPGYPWPTRAMPRWAVGPGLAVPWRMSRKGIRARYGRHYALSQQRAVGEVGVAFRETQETVRDTIDSLGDFGIVDLHARKSKWTGASARISARLSSVDYDFTLRKAASGRV